MMDEHTPELAFQRLLRPLVRFALARGMRVQDMVAGLKAVAVDAAVAEAARPPKVSHIAMMTGLQRREVKARLEEPRVAPAPSPVARVIGTWPGDRDELSRAEFDALVAGLSQDMHPRTMAEEMQRLGVAERTEDGVRLLRRALVAPGDDATQLGYLGANAGDHTTAAVANVLGQGPFLDQAVHYNGLTRGSVDVLEAAAREVGGEALQRVNSRARELQRQDGGTGSQRIRFGVFFYTEEDE